jgi:hypothetical protein
MGCLVGACVVWCGVVWHVEIVEMEDEEARES